jgi:phage virion morphogenesis protein
MASFNITVQDDEARAVLKALSDRVGNLRPILHTIGEGIVERTKRRFDTSTDPAGGPWKPNSAVTLGLFSSMLSGQKSKVRKDGSLNASGARALANKKPLIGESQDLRRQFTVNADNNSLTVGSTPAYAAIQQFGGKAGRGHKVTIPARPFLPIHQDGSLYPDDKAQILESLNAYLMGRP